MKLNEEILRIKKIMNLLVEENNFIQYMKMGTKNDEVKKLQEILKIDSSGEFNSETKKCVEEFQEHFKIKVDGIVGPETRNVLNNYLKGKTEGWTGCKSKTNGDSEETKKEIEVSTTPQVSSPETTQTNITQDKTKSGIVGSDWNSCKDWRSQGGLTKWGDLVSISKSDTEFNITYTGPSFGLAIAHAKKGKDTVHQIYNILICEINPFLYKGGIKPNIENITTTTGKVGKKVQISISVPLQKEEGTFQLDRRGGWNHDPGGGKMGQKCSTFRKKGKFCFGPIKNIANGSFGKITEYFIVHQI